MSLHLFMKRVSRTLDRRSRTFRNWNFVLLLALASGVRTAAEVSLSPLFQDHAVLQRDQPIPIWGRADPGETITVTFRDHRVSTTAPADGKWRVTLPALPADTRPAELVVVGRNTLRIADVLLGDVWICAGQSNMAFPVDPEPGRDGLRLDRQVEETAAANFPLVRHFRAMHTPLLAPAETVAGSWAICTPAAMRRSTAVGYFFARDIHQQLGVPVGIVESSWGGTEIESWMSAETLATHPAFQVVHQRWAETLAALPAREAKFKTALAAWEEREAAAAAGGAEALAAFHQKNPKPRPSRVAAVSVATPSGIYNGMIAPLVPYGIRGVLWYQGETNAGRPEEYAALFRAFITQWRKDWGRDDLPFYFVQLASFVAPRQVPGQWALLREAQAKALDLPATGMAVAIDNPDPTNLHPGNKQPIGHRLALIALAKTYGRDVEYSGPVLLSARREGSAFRLTFTHAGGLAATSPSVKGFAIAGDDRVFHPAEARIDGETILVSAPGVSEPVAVRYAWANAPEVSLINAAGLPAAPFRTDDW